MKSYAAILNKEKPIKMGTSWLDMFRQLETIRCIPQLQKENPVYTTPAYTWYPETEFCYFSTKYF